MSKAGPQQNLSVWLDVIRAAAAQAVVLGHVHQIFFSGQRPLTETSICRVLRIAIDGVGAVSHQAVIAFFVMSGYLVGGRALNDCRNGNFRPLRYLSDRVTRLWIVLLPALILTAILDWASFTFGSGEHILVSRQPFYPDWWATINSWGIVTAISNATFMQMIMSFQFGTNLSIWSISNEFWYYMLFPSLLFSFVGNGWKRILGAVVALLIIALFVSSGTPHFRDRAQYLCYFFIIWSAGAFAPFLRGKLRIATGCVGLAYALGWAIRRHFSIDPTFWGDGAVAALVLGLILLCQVFPARALAKPAKFTANYSYSLYAIHLPLVFFVMSFHSGLYAKMTYNLGNDTLYLAYVALTNLVAIVFWYLTERHTNTVRYRLRIWLQRFEASAKTHPEN
jgi:peptidoglycan/LPS O-acetylase OafA/YrhL